MYVLYVRVEYVIGMKGAWFIQWHVELMDDAIIGGQ